MSIAILTSSELRHREMCKVFRDRFTNIRVDVYTETFTLSNHVAKSTEPEEFDISAEHIRHRWLTEYDHFGYEGPCPILSDSYTCERGWFNSQSFLDICRRKDYNIVCVYGTSILRGGILEWGKGRILNLHLGLSPYYRGAGTNFFPYVNGVPEYAGASVLEIDAGIDTGKIIHQVRPEVFSMLDSFHQFSCRFLREAFKSYADVVGLYLSGSNPSNIDQQDLFFSNPTRVVYKKKDFTKESTQRLYDNLRSGMIEKYVMNYVERTSAVPIYKVL